MPKLKLSTDKKIRIQASLNRQKKAFKNSFKENDISKAVINKYRYYNEGIKTAAYQLTHPIETTKGAVKQAIDSNIYTKYAANTVSEAKLKLQNIKEEGGLGSWASDSFSKNYDKVNNKFIDIKNQVAENGVAGYSKTLALNGIKGAFNGSKTAAKTLAKATGAAGLAKATANKVKDTSEAVKRKFNSAKNTATAPIRAVNKVKSGAGKVKDEFNAIKKDPSNYLLGLAAAVPGAAKKLAEKARNSKIVKKTLEIVKRVMNVISVIWKPLVIGYLLITVSLGVMSGLSMVHVTPHYYCDLDAPKLVKKTTEYKKYCTTNCVGSVEGLTDAEWNDFFENSQYYQFSPSGNTNICDGSNNIGWPFNNCTAPHSVIGQFNKLICASFVSGRYWQALYPDEDYPLHPGWNSALIAGNASGVDKINQGTITNDPSEIKPGSIIHFDGASFSHVVFVEAIDLDGSITISESNWTGIPPYGFQCVTYSSFDEFLARHGGANPVIFVPAIDMCE